MKFLATLLPLLTLAVAAPLNDGKGKDTKAPAEHKAHFKNFPFEFTSTAVAWARPETIVNNSQVAVPGLAGGYGTFAFGLNSIQDVICYNITLYLKGGYQSPAVTATHIHEAVAGRAGPPRLAFANPVPLDRVSGLDVFSWRASFGCLQGPFRTGINGTDGADTGTGFTIAKLEANLPGFFADTHTVQFPAGAVRGQLMWQDYYY